MADSTTDSPEDISTTLQTLATSLESTLTSLPSPSDSASISAPKNGISLLDVKNDLLLSYLHNLSLLALLRFKSVPFTDHSSIDELVKLRLLLERGVKPLEQKLKYQIDKVILAAATKDDEELSGPKTNTKGRSPDASDASSGSDTDSEASEDESEQEAERKRSLLAATAPAPSDLAHRPNPSSLIIAKKSDKPARASKSADGIYKPPRIAATIMPELAQTKEKRDRAPTRNHALDDFVADELSVAPIAQPSIGSTIAAHGRVHKTARDRKEEAQRREFEENNLMRLPKMSKKDAREARIKNRGEQEAAFGGEDWRSFAGDLDRLTKSAEKSGKGEKVLERSRKRRGEDGDGGGVGERIGAHYQGRKNLVNKKRRV
jgi:U3 small nucleolar ribonucleoprotein protein LCP5